MKKVQSDNGHLWYAKDDDGKIHQVSMFEDEIDKYIEWEGKL